MDDIDIKVMLMEERQDVMLSRMDKHIARQEVQFAAMQKSIAMVAETMVSEKAKSKLLTTIGASLLLPVWIALIAMVMRMLNHTP